MHVHIYIVAFPKFQGGGCMDYYYFYMKCDRHPGSTIFHLQWDAKGLGESQTV